MRDPIPKTKRATASNSVLQPTPAMDRAHHAISASTRWSKWKAPRRPGATPARPSAERRWRSYERPWNARPKGALATWPMGEEVRFRDRAGLIALDIVAEVIFGVADNPRAERVRARAIAWLAPPQHAAGETAWGDSLGGR